MNSNLYEFDPNECAATSCPLECQSIDYDLRVSSLVSPSLVNYQLTSDYDDFCCFYHWPCPNGEYIRDIWNCDQQCFEPLINFTQISYEKFRRYFVSFDVFYSNLV
jgi:hypothetical protein